MNALEKILEEIDNRKSYHEEKAYKQDDYEIQKMYCSEELDWITNIIRSHMNDIENDGWIQVEEKLPEEGEEVLAQFVVRVRYMNNKVDEAVYIHTMHYENGAWKSYAGVPNGKVEAWQPLPKPYKGE